jgi:hypothetical protein
MTRRIARLFIWAGHACLAAAVATAALSLPLAAATAAEGEEWPSSSFQFNEKDGTVIIEWPGPIVPGMADYLRTAIDKYATASHRVVLFLNSAGGQVDEGDRVIHILDEIKPTHRLISTNTGERIYHLPGQKYYFATRINWLRGERWFCSESDARAAGWRKSRV